MSATDPSIDELLLDHIERVVSDTPYALATEFKIVDQNGDLVEFGDLYPAPAAIVNYIDDCHAAGKAAVFWVLKARRHRVTSSILAAMVAKSIGRNGLRMMVVADDHDLSKPCRGMMHGYISNMGEYVAPEIITGGQAETEMDLVWRSVVAEEQATSNKCSFASAQSAAKKVSATQDAGGAGRGDRKNFVLMTEAGFLPGAKQIHKGLKQTCREHAGNIFAVESTANGATGWFHENFMAAYNDPDGARGRAFFFPWYTHPEYTASHENKMSGGAVPTFSDEEQYAIEMGQRLWREGKYDDAALEFHTAGLSEFEVTLATEHNLNADRIAWARWCVQAMCQGHIEVFHQEYPTTVELAFQYTGYPCFNREALEVYSRTAEQGEPFAADYDLLVDNPLLPHAVDPNIQWSPKHDGKLHVLQKPKPGHHYIIGADASNGVGADYTAAAVMEVETGRYVAYIRDNRMRPTEFAKQLIMAGRWYNDANLVIEDASPGNSVIDLISLACYPNIYVRQTIDAKPFAEFERRYGYPQSVKARNLLIDGFRNAIDDGLHEFNVTAIVEEAKHFVGKMTNNLRELRFEAEAGWNDDLLFAAMLASHVYRMDADLQQFKKLKEGRFKGVKRRSEAAIARSELEVRREYEERWLQASLALPRDDAKIGGEPVDDGWLHL